MKRIRRPDLVHLCEEAYRLDLDEDAWLESVSSTAVECLGLRVADCGVFTFNCERDPRSREPVLGGRYHAGPTAWMAETLDPVVDELDPRGLHATYPLAPMVGHCLAHMRGQGIPEEAMRMKPHIDAHGFADVFGLLAVNPDGVGTMISVPVEEVVPIDPAAAQTWLQATVHIAAAARMRRRLRDVPGGWEREAVAIFEPDGRLAHAADEAPVDALSDLVDAHHPRRRRDLDAAQAFALWRGLLEGRYSLLEQADVDDHRYLILLENDPGALFPSALTRRERQVVTYAAYGHDNVTISYELGLSESTVATHFSNAMRKLSVPTRAELVVLFHQLALDAYASP